MTVHMEAAQSLLACYESALAATAQPPAKVGLRHGAEVVPQLGTQEDECCSGLAWVRIVSVENISAEDPNAVCVGSQRRLTLEMGAVSCLGFGTVENPLSADAWTDVALLQDAYHGAMEAALCCAYEDLATVLGVHAYAGPYEPTGPDGNCVGAVMQVIVETDCGCATGEGS